jgi:hypothetical protein
MTSSKLRVLKWLLWNEAGAVPGSPKVTADALPMVALAPLL